MLIHQNNLSSLYQGNCEELLKSIPDSSIDMVCIDPPYTDGKTHVLNKHKIQTQFSIENVTTELYRILKNDSFYACFGSMPTLFEWYTLALQIGFKFKIDIIWCKKKGSPGGNKELKRTHELIYIFTKGDPKYFKTKQIYSDVSQAQVEYNIKDIESIFRHLSYYKGLSEGKTLQNRVIKKTDFNIKTVSTFKIKKGEDTGQTFGLEDVHFNSVWAFSPHNCRHRNAISGQIPHPTVKSIPLLERLIELCSKEGDVVLDCFGGSGTTALAALNTKRNYILMELYQEYCELIKNRIEKHYIPFKQQIIE